MKIRSAYLWIFAFVVVAFAAVYQRMTGPTYPVRCSVRLGDSDLRFRLLRSSDAGIRGQARSWMQQLGG